MTKLTRTAQMLNLEGDPYDIGKNMAMAVEKQLELSDVITDIHQVDREKAKKQLQTLSRHFPDIQGFFDFFSLDILQSKYLQAAFFYPKCSQLAINHRQTNTGHTIMGSNFD